MRPLKLASFLAFLLSVLVTVILAVTGIVLAEGYKRIVTNDLNTTLIKIAQEIQQNHLIFIDNTIKYRRTPGGLSISENLRSKETSALIVDAKLTPIGRWGIFNFESMLGSQFSHELLDTVQQVHNSGKSHFVPNQSFENNSYELYVAPLTVNHEFQGAVVLAKQSEVPHRLITLNNQLILIILPLALFIFWCLSFWIISFGLKPLKNLAEILDQLTLTTTPTPMNLKTPKFVELASLFAAFNRLFFRVTQTLEKQKNFVANASHELRTPLTRAISTLDLVLLDNKEPGIREPLKIVEQELFSLNKTLEELLVLAKLEANQTTSLSPPLSIKPILEQLLQLNEAEINRKSLSLSLAVDNLFALNISKEMALILFRNILTNGVKYNIMNGQVAIKADTSNHIRSIAFKNSSGPLEPTLNSRLFERFYRGKGTKTIKGSGLGLSIVQTIAEQSNLKVVAHILSDNVFEVVVTQPI